MELRYGQLLASFYTVMLFATGIPLMYAVFLLQTVVIYWLDKCLFLRVHRSPPRYGSELADKAHSLMQVAPILHLLVGFMMLSSTLIFSDQRVLEVT